MKFSQRLSQGLVHIGRILITILILTVFLGVVYLGIKNLTSRAHLSKSAAPLIEEEVETPKGKEISLEGQVDINTVADTLLAQGLIKDKASFIQVATEMGVYSYFGPGDFTIPQGATVKEMIHSLTKDKIASLQDVSVTLPHNVTSDQVADILLAQGLISSKPAFVQRVNSLGVQGQFKAGSHKLSAPIKVDDLIKTLCQEVEK
ncbi:hypothetical protein HMPREF1633_13665 [Tissierellia bacterium S5-A11]|nr:hypothetical protein HMPREF1633_13665 [Tissierellia bacterium S5-A11]